MKLPFFKYQGTGNDFIIFDNREFSWNPGPEVIAALCHRRFGIGADGLMLLENAEGYDFGMRYYNSDGLESTMCGNGGRCITALASNLGLCREKASFLAVDGPHEAHVMAISGDTAYVKLKMKDCSEIIKHPDGIFLDTGSPHFVVQTKNPEQADVVTAGRILRNDSRFQPGGANINFIEIREGSLFVRTYERGVEDETLSCGTGVTAAALATACIRPENGGTYRILTRGGELRVSFMQTGCNFTNIWLEGDAVCVFTGLVDVEIN